MRRRVAQWWFGVATLDDALTGGVCFVIGVLVGALIWAA